MKKVVLSPLQHEDQRQIRIDFTFDSEIKEHLKALKEIFWNSTSGCYCAIYSKESFRLVYTHLRAKNWFVDYKAFRSMEASTEKKISDSARFSRLQKKTLHEYVNYLRGQRLSESSVRTYYNFVLKLVEFLGEKDPAKLQRRDIELFIEQKIAGQNYAISTHRQCISSIVHFLKLHNTAIDLAEIKRPHKSRFLPTVLSKEEAINLLKVTRNLKHRAVLAMIYSCGLRIGELLALELVHIDIQRRQIHVKNSKGRKDRMVVLAQAMIPLINNYLCTYKPQRYFVEGAGAGKYSAQSIRAFLQSSCLRAGIYKKVTPHTLRHSYATHMLENGIDLRYIQELLGHSKPETTMIYTHVSQKSILKIESPLDVTLKEMHETAKKDENMLLSRRYDL